MKLVSDSIIYLRYFELKDDIEYFKMTSNENIGYNAGWKPHSNIKLTQNNIAYYLISKETMAIIRASDDKFIGTISLYKETFRKGIRAYNIGFSINEDYWNMGYATRACKLALKLAFEKFDAEIVGIGCHKDNLKSERVINKCGFTYEGLIRKYKLLYDGREVDAKLYSMTKEEYERNKLI